MIFITKLPGKLVNNQFLQLFFQILNMIILALLTKLGNTFFSRLIKEKKWDKIGECEFKRIRKMVEHVWLDFFII